MESVGFILALAGVLFVFAGLTGVVIWWSNGNVTAYLKSNVLRIAGIILGVLFICMGFYLDFNKQQKNLSKEEVELLIKSIEGKVSQQQEFITTNQSALSRQNDELSALFAEVRAIDAGINQSYTDQHSNLLQVVTLLAQRNRALGCTKTETAYQKYIPISKSMDLCDQVSALRYAVSIYIKDGIDSEKLRSQFIALGQPAYITTDEESKSGIADTDLAIVFPEGAPRELICIVHAQFQKRVANEGSTKRIIPYLLSTKELGQIAGLPGESRYTIGLGIGIKQGSNNLKPMTVQAWRDICKSNYTQEGFEDFVKSLLITP